MAVIHHHVRPAFIKQHHGAAAQSLPPLIADLEDFVIIPLTHQQQAVAHLTVDIAFQYHVSADDELLLQSLSITLVDFPGLCGRALKLRRGDTVAELVLCVPKAKAQHDADATTSPSWAHVPFTFDTKRPINDDDRNGVAPNVWFDMAANCIPPDSCDLSSFAKDEIYVSKFGDPMTRIRVSTASMEHQVIAISMNHTLVDAGSISLFMTAWSRHYQRCRGLCGAETNQHEDVVRPITFAHPIFEMDVHQNDKETSIPVEWTRLLPNKSGGENPFVENKAIENEKTNVSCTIYYRSRDQMEVLKQKCLEETNRQIQQQRQEQNAIRAPTYFSSNDALLGEVCKQLEATSMLLCMDWRPVLNQSPFFGYAVLFLYLDFPASSDAPAACRNILGWEDISGEEGCKSIVRDSNFVMWKLQNETKQGMTDLIWNSWTDFFTLHDQDCCSDNCSNNDNFAKMECCPHDMFMSEKMCRARVDVARRGLSYAIIFPQPNRSVRVYFFGPSEVGRSLQQSMK